MRAGSRALEQLGDNPKAPARAWLALDGPRRPSRRPGLIGAEDPPALSRLVEPSVLAAGQRPAARLRWPLGAACCSMPARDACPEWLWQNDRNAMASGVGEPQPAAGPSHRALDAHGPAEQDRPPGTSSSCAAFDHFVPCRRNGGATSRASDGVPPLPAPQPRRGARVVAASRLLPGRVDVAAVLDAARADDAALGRRCRSACSASQVWSRPWACAAAEVAGLSRLPAAKRAARRRRLPSTPNSRTSRSRPAAPRRRRSAGAVMKAGQGPRRSVRLLGRHPADRCGRSRSVREWPTHPWYARQPWLWASISTLGRPSRSPSAAMRLASANRSARRSTRSSCWAMAPCHCTAARCPGARPVRRVGRATVRHRRDRSASAVRLAGGPVRPAARRCPSSRPAGRPRRCARAPRPGYRRADLPHRRAVAGNAAGRGRGRQGRHGRRRQGAR